MTKRVSARDVERDLDGVVREVRRHVRVQLGLEDEQDRGAPLVEEVSEPSPLPEPPALLTSRRAIARNRRVYSRDDRRRQAPPVDLLARRRRWAIVVLAVLALVLLQVESRTGAVSRAYTDVIEWAVRGVLEPLAPKPTPTPPG